MDLANEAYRLGRAAAYDYKSRDEEAPPAVTSQPRSLTVAAKRRTGEMTVEATPAEMETVREAWERGVQEVWYAD